MILGIRINKRILLSSRITGANGHVGCSTSIHSAGIFFFVYKSMWCYGSHFFRKRFIEGICRFPKINGTTQWKVKGKDVKDFLNFCKPYFTNKGVCNDEKILVEKEEILRKDSKIFGTFNSYFVNITDELGIYNWGNIPQNCLDITEKVSSIKTIKDKFRKFFNFKFEFVSANIILRLTLRKVQAEKYLLPLLN